MKTFTNFLLSKETFTIRTCSSLASFFCKLLSKATFERKLSSVSLPLESNLSLTFLCTVTHPQQLKCSLCFNAAYNHKLHVQIFHNLSDNFQQMLPFFISLCSLLCTCTSTFIILLQTKTSSAPPTNYGHHQNSPASHTPRYYCNSD